MLEVSGLTGGWGPTIIVEDVSFSVAPGETLAIIGRNGVGKSTLFELLAGRASRRAGEIRIAGEDVSALPIYRRATLGLGYVPQQREVFPSLTVREHLTIASRAGRWTPAAVLDLFPSLAARLGSLGGQLSGGEQQMLAIGRALVGNPRVILMDEPSEGLAPVVVEHLIAAVRSVAGEGAMSVVLIEQRIDIAVDLAPRCLVMERGRIVFEGRTAELTADRRDLGALLGLGQQDETVVGGWR
jgi:branched-chain amino acid transport system ATP-binding protein